MRLPLSSLSFLSLLGLAYADITVYYTQVPLATATQSGGSSAYTGSAAYNPKVLNPPALPSPLPANAFNLPIVQGGVPGMSIRHIGGFFGFSVEMSVANQVLGKNSSLLQVPFLNLLGTLQSRSGEVRIRVGGNTQDFATWVASLPNGKSLQKDYGNITNPTATPPLDFTDEIMYMMSNISSMVNTKWYMGVPFIDPTNWRLQVMERGQAILGNNLLGFQASNEPDFYVSHNHRPANWGPADYYNEFGSLIKAMAADNLILNQSSLIAPSVSGNWMPEQVWDTGFMNTYISSIMTLAVEHYPNNNCAAQYAALGPIVDPQTIFASYLRHDATASFMQWYPNSTMLAQTWQKPFIMMETNTGSCGGFAGLSDSFGAALWGLDYAMTMAYNNFTGAMFHVGGQSVYYNPFTPPPTNQSTFHQWTIGPIYYSALVMAEILGSSNRAQVYDLQANSASVYTPGYSIYEDGVAVRVALFNYMTDPSGANDYTATISITGGTVPASVKVKYLAASSVAQKANFTWAGQTFGGHFDSDGRIMGEESIQTVACNAGTCAVKVPAPGFALVFLTDAALTESDAAEAKTFSTTAVTKSHNTATIDPAVLSTSNGHSGMGPGGDMLGSTSQGKASGAMKAGLSGAVAFLGVAVGGFVIGRALGR